MAELPSPTTTSPTAIASTGYAPYGQLAKMLLPSAGSIAIYDAAGELLWCSDGYETPDLRALLDGLRAAGNDTLAGRGSIEQTSGGVPAFVSALTGEAGQPLGAFVVELNSNQTSRYTSSMIASMLRPVLDCLENRMNLEHTVLLGERDQGYGLDLLLTVDEDDREDASALEHLLRHCVEHLGCVMGALLIPDKNLAVSCSSDESLSQTHLLDRTQKHLLAWAQLNNRPMVVNRVATSTEVAPYKILTCPVRDVANRVTGLVALFRVAAADDFELRDVRIIEFVSRKAVSILNSQYDGLTGLVNRLIFERRVQGQLDSAEQVRHALLYIDIDKLQAINEAFGLHAGDEVIHRVGDVLQRAAGAAAITSRVAGDRFAVFLADRDTAQAADLAKVMLAATAQLGYVNGSESVPVSVSIGIATVLGSDERVAHLLAAAELACKRSKEQGRNRFTVHDANDELLPARRQMMAAAGLQDALKNNDFRLEAQPIVGLATRSGQMIAQEIFVRMRSATGEVLAPDKFLDAAERYELLPALDRWVLCSTIEALRPLGQAVAALPYCFAINVSAQSLASCKYAAFALEQIERAGLPPAAFCFELKESAAVGRLPEAEQMIRDLTKAGSRVALDDFGYGLSSLAHLKRLPVQYLKIDGRFVRRILNDRVAESIVSGIARAAKTLGVSAIAEHVESAALATRLRELEVDYGQGFFLGRPVPFAPAPESEIEPAPIALGAKVS
jgi:diguanylate cyclase (GGDEF)-like protein